MTAGWLGSATEGRRPQSPGRCAGGSSRAAGLDPSHPPGGSPSRKLPSGTDSQSQIACGPVERMPVHAKRAGDDRSEDQPGKPGAAELQSRRQDQHQATGNEIACGSQWGNGRARSSMTERSPITVKTRDPMSAST